ncbi:MAG: TIGR04255 family protein, partial [Bacteroidetes bacterium]|nr:TIGR04255 family protein [Bacteroidota bacterium]
MAKTSKTRKKAPTVFPHLRKAPIAEAVIEVRGPIGVEWNEEAVLIGMSQLGDRYPVHHSLQGFQGQWQLKPGSEPRMETKDLGSRGLRFQSQDGLDVPLLTADLFSFSRLQPYQTWDTFVSGAIKVWKIYKQLLQQNDITRLGVRFINRIPFSEEKVKVARYFK